MSDELQPPTPAPRPVPIALRSPAERHAHVVARLKERGGIEWTPEKVLTLEKKIRLVRSMVNGGKGVAPILPKKLGEEKNGTVHRYRVLIGGEAHTFAFSQIARGLISYVGKGELLPPVEPVAEKPAV